MSRLRVFGPAVILATACLLGPAAGVGQQPQPPAKKTPKLEPVAETKLLMNGLADPNVKSLGKLLRSPPKDAEAWPFARGQALLVAETGNLLMIRPPKAREAQDTWMTLAGDLRDAGAALARAAASRDYLASRTALAGVANACNRCHRAFKVATRVDPFEDDAK